MNRRTGIYPGTFDPVHPGHIAFAMEAMQACGLDEVIFLPEQQPRGKRGVTAMAHRVALLERATADCNGLRVVSLHSSKQFTVQDTLPELQHMFGAAELTLLVGSDMVRTFLYRWPGLDVLFQKVSVAIGMRVADEPDEITAIMEELEREYAIPVHYQLICTPEAHAASSHIRNGTADMSLLPSSMTDYMRDERLYLQDMPNPS